MFSKISNNFVDQHKIIAIIIDFDNILKDVFDNINIILNRCITSNINNIKIVFDYFANANINNIIFVNKIIENDFEIDKLF